MLITSKISIANFAFLIFLLIFRHAETKKKKMDHTQWSMGAMSMNPAFYQGIPNANVDWAALAAQWIHMRETLPTDQLSLMPEAPPPPTITLLDNSSIAMRLEDEEKGEAPMDMEKDEDDVVPTFDTSNNFVQGKDTYRSESTTTMPFASNNVQNTGNHVQNWRNPAWQMYNVTPSAPNLPVTSKPPPLCPELQGYTGRKRWANRSPNRETFSSNQTHAQTTEDNNAEDVETLDAAKRKTLPAWIREGLEKMEREKQKEEERIKMEEQRKKLAEERRKIEEETLQELESTKGLRSKFVSVTSETMFNNFNDKK